MKTASEGLGFVLEHHQRSFAATGEQRLTVFDLIRAEGGKNNLQGYKDEVSPVSKGEDMARSAHIGWIFRPGHAPWEVA